jgi:hypothetical protein
MRASAAAEKAGIRSVSIVTSAFLPQAAVISRLLSRDLSVAEYPGVVATDDDETFRSRVVGQLVPNILAGLARPQQFIPSTHRAAAHTTVYSGDLDGVQDEFERRRWTDGLPVMPPTIDRVMKYLEHTPRAPEEILGIAWPAGAEATVWSVAVNAVMAGCPPQLMPVLVAAIEGLLDPEFRLEDGGSTPGWEPIAIVSGAMIDDLDFNCRGAALRVGTRANTSLGRFIRLYMRNVAGLRPHPESTDKACIGMGINVALAENEHLVRAAGWPTYAEEKGFRFGENVVTVESIRGISAPIYAYGDDPSVQIEHYIDCLGGLGAVGGTASAVRHGDYHALIVMSPAIMDVFARKGMTKDDIRQEIGTRTLLSMEKLVFYGQNSGAGKSFDIERLVRLGLAPEIYLRPDVNGMVPVFPWPEKIDIVVAGDPGRNQSRCYINNHIQGAPIRRRVQFTEADAATHGTPRA